MQLPTLWLAQSEGNNLCVITAKIKEINKWLAQFDYDFKVAVERIGLSDETEIVHRKNKIKIPASQGGSGADYLLTFLSEYIAAKNNILLLEEPEKALHAKMQVELSKFFVTLDIVICLENITLIAFAKSCFLRLSLLSG